jgi:hypothetical protein
VIQADLSAMTLNVIVIKGMNPVMSSLHEPVPKRTRSIRPETFRL